MTALFANPTNQNLAQGNKFAVSFTRLPYIQFFLQDINLPGMNASIPEQPTPFINVPVAPNKMTYELLTMTWLLDEPLWSWSSVVDWFKGFTIPDNFQEYQDLSMQQRLQMASNPNKVAYSDATLIILTNKNNPILSIHFEDIFPTNVGSIEFSTKKGPLDVMTCSASFAFKTYTISRV